MGANGFVGIHILASLLTHDTGTIYCIVRSKNGISAYDRFMKVLHFYFGTNFDFQVGKRIQVVEGEVTKENFNLSHLTLAKLQEQITYVINAAAMVKHYGQVEKFNAINVDATRHILDFCLKYKKKLLHLSSLSVSGNMSLDGDASTQQNGINDQTDFCEKNLFIGQSLQNIYIKTKFEAERLILDAISTHQLQAQILRLGNITNRFKDGVFQMNAQENAFMNRLLSFIRIGYLPDYLLSSYVEFTPVDSCADAIVSILQNATPNFTVYHIYDNNHLYIRDLIKFLAVEGVIIKPLSQKDFAKKVITLSTDPNKKNVLTGIINDLDQNYLLHYTSNVHILSEFSRAILHRIGFRWPSIDALYIKRYVEYLRKNKLI